MKKFPPSNAVKGIEALACLSVIVPCFNEETVIAECLESVRFADEIVVVDSFSTDRTLEIARRYTDRILQHEFWSHGAQNNWAIPQAKHDWVLIVDAEERVTPALADEMRTLLRAPMFDGYWMRRRNFFINKEIRHGTWRSDSVLRLFRRDKGRYQEKHVHSQVELKGQAGLCQEAIIHYSFRSLDDYMRKVHRFSQGGALNMHSQGKRSGVLKMITHGVGGFLKSYVLKLGAMDGVEGFLIACLESYLAFLKYAKLWELQNRSTACPPPQNQ